MAKTSGRNAVKPKKLGFFGKHPGLRFFLITFLCCCIPLAIFTIYLVYQLTPHPVTAKQQTEPFSNVSSKPAAASSSNPASPFLNLSFNMLIANIDDSSNKPVQLSLLRLDAANDRVAVMPIPLELLVNSSGTDHSIADEFAATGINGIKDCYSKITNIKIDYTCVIQSSKFSGVIDNLGGIDFGIPQDISYTMPDSSIVQIQKGTQHLNGKQAVALINFSGYPEGNIKKYTVQNDLLKAFIIQKLNGHYIDNVNITYKDVFKNIESGFSLNDLSNRVALLRILAKRGNDFVKTVTPCYVPVIIGSISLLNYDQNAPDFFKNCFNLK